MYSHSFVWPVMTDHLEKFFEDCPARMDAGEVARILGVTRQVVYKWLNKGVIPGYKLGDSWLVLRDELRDSMRETSNRNSQSNSES